LAEHNPGRRIPANRGDPRCRRRATQAALSVHTVAKRRRREKDLKQEARGHSPTLATDKEIRRRRSHRRLPS
jgi:hypothetical protein